MSIDLLLTDVSDLAPVLGELVEHSAGHAPPPEQRVPSSLVSSDDLGLEMWGVVVPNTAAGEQMLQWIRPLCELRMQQCGAIAIDDLPVFRVAPGMSLQEARRWRVEYEQIARARRPGYLLILGDLHEVSHELQQELMMVAGVGRLCFTTPDGQPDRAGYEAYCAKVRAAEATRPGWNARARLLFYVSHDGSTAIQDGYHDLIRRCYVDAGKDPQLAAEGLHLFGRDEDHEWYTGDASLEARSRTLLHTAEMPEPAVLMSLTHGAGVTDPAWQRLRQGAVVLRESAGQQRTEILDHTFFARRFLPGGFWFFKACFGAGTPVASTYERWLEKLYQLGRYGENPRTALTYLATSSQPFIARVPQVTLAHPDGPLGVLGHVDLAWTFGFQGLDEADLASIHGDHSPYYEVLRMLVCGSRFGRAVASLSDKAQRLGTHLATLYREAEAGGSSSEKLLGLRAWLWMRYLDLSGYILLGDPACQVPTSAARALAEHEQRRSAGATPPAPGPSVDRMEEAVLACLRQRKSPGEVAREAGIHPTTLERWLRIYKDAGRRALAELGAGGNGKEDDA
jgi:hypothetical protein